MDSYFINNQKFSEQDLLDEASQKIDNSPEWESEIWQSILDWFNESESIVFKTSGTTGMPKEIIHSKHAIKKSAEITRAYFDLPPGSNVLLCLPANFVAGKMMIFRSLICKWNLHFIQPRSNLNLDGGVNYDFAAVVPMQIESALHTDQDPFIHIKKVLVGGTSLSQAQKDFALSHKSQFFESYGSTETLTHVAIRNIQKNGTFLAIGDVTFDVNGNNCLVIQAPHISEEPIESNDMVNLISDREFEYIGRIDHIINSGGVKLHPNLIEDKIKGVVDSNFYIGKMPDELLGEKVVLYIEDESAESIDKVALGKELDAKLNKFERPKEIIVLKKFDRTFSGKIKRSQ